MQILIILLLHACSVQFSGCDTRRWQRIISFIPIAVLAPAAAMRDKFLSSPCFPRNHSLGWDAVVARWAA